VACAPRGRDSPDDEVAQYLRQVGFFRQPTLWLQCPLDKGQCVGYGVGASDESYAVLGSHRLETHGDLPMSLDRERGEATEEFVSQLRSALGHLDDVAYLANHALAGRIGSAAELPGLSRGRALRDTLHVAMEMLHSAAPLATNAVETRRYEILCRHYVAKRAMPKIAREMGICERHAYRELRHATEALAQVLIECEQGQDQKPGLMSERAARVREEVELLSTASSQDVDLVQLVEAVVRNVHHLARDRHIGIRVEATVPSLCIAANRVMLRQALLNLLSHMVRTHEGDQLAVRLSRSGNSAFVQATYRPQSQMLATLLHPGQPYAVSEQLLDSLGIRRSRDRAEDGTIRVSCSIPFMQEHTVLIVDDNEGITDLYTRYLQHSSYRAHCANSFEEALDSLHRLLPDVVLLDVMMPRHDGWELMERLCTTGSGRRARVVVCSIINDPDLALTLGADAFLNKPVKRADLLQTLDQVLLSVA